MVRKVFDLIVDFPALVFEGHSKPVFQFDCCDTAAVVSTFM